MSEDIQNEVVEEEPVEETPVEEAEVGDPIVDERDVKCEPVASKILEIIVKHAPSAKTLSHEEYIENFAPIQKDIVQLMLENDFTISDANYTFTITQSIFDQAKRLTNDSLQNVFESAQVKLFGVEHMRDLTLKKLDDILTSSNS